MIRFCLFMLCLLQPLSILFAQNNDPVPAAFAPYFTAADAEHNRMYQYLKLSLNISRSDPALKIKYADSAVALGEDYGTTEQWLYARLYRAELEEIYGDIGATEELLEAISRHLIRMDHAHLQGFYYSLMAELEKDKEHPERQLQYLNKALSSYEKAQNPYEQGKQLMKIGIFLHDQKGEVDSGISTHQRALKAFRQSGEESAIYRCLGDLATMYMRAGRYKESMTAFYQVIRYYESVDNQRGLGRSYFDLGLVYLRMDDYEKALECFQKSRAFSEAIEDNDYLARNYSTIAKIYLHQGGAGDSVIYYQEKAIQLFQKLKRYDHASTASMMLALSCYKLGHYGKAYQFIAEQFQQPYIFQNKQNLSSTYGLYAAVLSAAQDAVPEINRLPNRDSLINACLDSCIALNEQIGKPAALIKAWESYATIKANIGAYKDAFRGYNTFIRLRDSIENLDKKSAIIRLETEFKYAKRQDSLKYVHTLAQQQLSNQRLVAQHQSQLLLNLNQESAIRKLALENAKTSLDLETAEGENLQRMLTIANQEQKLKQASLDEVKQENALQRLQLRQQWILGITLLAGIGGIGGFIYYRNKNRQNQVKLELERQVSDAMLKSLHSQMNPHFIFNSLASVKSYIAGNNPRKATNYLNSFADLIRRILHSSQQGAITFAEELETIRVYLSLEQERFKEKFNFSIHWKSYLKAETVLVPALFLQPYVENAVWHGMAQRKTEGHIEIEVSDTFHHLVVRVKDNGRGVDENHRQRRSLGQGKKGKSYGMALSMKRLTQFWGDQTTVSLKNRKAESGALLTINIPLKSLNNVTTESSHTLRHSG